ncbi:hypothetical protein KSF73_07240 [Burkholderiaceae bacterium DAT-1]|nr:hypothetical protein [Burkholderiaceae bacterium DAT-1]
MDTELIKLEEKLTTLVGLCRQLRTENQQFRQEILELRRDNKRLSDKVEGARTRIDALLARLPAEVAEEEAP